MGQILHIWKDRQIWQFNYQFKFKFKFSLLYQQPSTWYMQGYYDNF